VIILDIKQPGLFLEIPGFSPVRTPAKIDITKHDTSLIIRRLASLGVQEYTISQVEDPKIQKSPPIKIEKDKPIDINKRLGRIEALLEKLAETGPVDFNGSIVNLIDGKESLPKSRYNYEDEDEIFIPKIKTTGMKMEGDLSQSIEETNDDTNESADLLKKLKDKK